MSRLLVILLVSLILMIALLIALLQRTETTTAKPPPYDFVEYWSAARLLWQGRNPYDMQSLEPLQVEAGRNAEDGPLPMLNPPYVLPLIMFLGLFPSSVALLIWLIVLFAVMIFTSDAIYRFYGGPDSFRLVAIAVGLSFVPTLSALTIRQISPLLLLGTWMFLVLIRGRRDGWAGAATVLLAIKPHVCYLVWFAILLWSVQTRRWRVIAGGVFAGLTLTALASAFRPTLVVDYVERMRLPLNAYESPVWGTLLRHALGGLDSTPFVLQYVPVLFGIAWMAFAWPHLREKDWPQTLPVLIIMSLLTAPYGAWLFDLVLLLLPLLHLLARLLTERKYIPVFAVLHGTIAATLLTTIMIGTRYVALIWVTPVIGMLYLLGLSLVGGDASETRKPTPAIHT